MTFKEIASKITGISFPIFGVSWQPIQSDIGTAKKVITFLEDRRVLYNPYELESPKHCYESVIKIREFLTEQIHSVTEGSEIDDILRGMRAACRKVLDKGSFHNVHPLELDRSSMGPLDQIIFYSAVGVFRGTMGILIAKLVIMYGLSFEENLLSVIPHE